jgi:hypothetical protein
MNPMIFIKYLLENINKICKYILSLHFVQIGHYFFVLFVEHCQNLRIFSCVNGFSYLNVTTCQNETSFGAFKGLVEQKNVAFNSFVCKLGSF